MQIETLSYSADVSLIGTLCAPERAEPGPAVLVFSDIFGLGDHARERAARLAELGYVTLAADLHGNGRLLAMEELGERLGAFYADPDVPCGRGIAALEQLRARPDVDSGRIGAIGFCYGGTLALEMARKGIDLAAVVGFHSVLKTNNPDGGKRIRGKVLACIGSEDPEIGLDQRAAFEQEMRAAEVDWQLHLYGGVYHTFTDPRCDEWGMRDFARYDAVADRRSWEAMTALLREVF